ncbi:lipoprotein N-acyltransferase Lnb domain-containing protein [Larkinella ripae]
MFCLLLFSFPPFLSSSIAQTLSPQAKISLITVAPGDEVYTSFGHTAFWVSDPMYGVDKVYNYGTFASYTDNYYLKFLQGTLPYYVSVYPMPNQLYASQVENRSVKEQVLNLSAAQRQRLYTMLETNALPENREYRYKFYYDNCATRPRDMLVKACGDSLRFVNVVDSTRSYRDWMNDYLTTQPWARMGMNLGIGRPADETASAWEAMYLPDNVFAEAERAQLKSPDGRATSLVANSLFMFRAVTVEESNGFLAFLLSPDFVFAVLLVAVFLITRRQQKRGLRGFWLDRWLFGFSGVWGWLLIFLWFFTDHGVTTWNPAVLFLMPLHLPLIFWVSHQTNSKTIRTYFLLTGVGLLAFILYAALHHYLYGYGFFWLTLLYRAFHQYRFASTQTEQPTYARS